LEYKLNRIGARTEPWGRPFRWDLQELVSLPMCTLKVSIMDLYSAESWSISTVLCVLSGNDKIDSSSAIVWSCCSWASDHGNWPVASSGPSDLRQKRSDNRKCWAGNVVWLGAGICQEICKSYGMPGNTFWGKYCLSDVSYEAAGASVVTLCVICE